MFPEKKYLDKIRDYKISKIPEGKLNNLNWMTRL